MPDLILTTLEDSVLTISLNRPDKRNALSLELIEALGAAVERAHENNDAARVVIFAGEGKSFCAGMDLKGVVEDVPAMTRMLFSLAQVSMRIRALPMPTIARVQGAAVGGGCGLAVVTDFAFTHPEAKLGYPEVDLGVCPAVVAPWLIRKIGPGAARAMLLAGGTMSGTEAASRGLVDRLVPRESLESEVSALASTICSGGANALATTKAWLNTLDGSLEPAIAQRAAALSAEIIGGEEAQARLRPLFGS